MAAVPRHEDEVTAAWLDRSLSDRLGARVSDVEVARIGTYADRVTCPMPTCLLADVDLATGRGVLVLEDLAHLEQGDSTTDPVVLLDWAMVTRGPAVLDLVHVLFVTWTCAIARWEPATEREARIIDVGIARAVQAVHALEDDITRLADRATSSPPLN